MYDLRQTAGVLPSTPATASIARSVFLFAAAFGWNALANVHYAFFSGFLVAVAMAWAWLRAVPERGRRIGTAVVATAVASLPFLPFAAGYRAASRLYGFRRGLSEIQVFSGRWTDFLSAGEKNWMWGAVTARFQAPERHFFPGVAAIALAGRPGDPASRLPMRSFSKNPTITRSGLARGPASSRCASSWLVL